MLQLQHSHPGLRLLALLACTLLAACAAQPAATAAPPPAPTADAVAAQPAPATTTPPTPTLGGGAAESPLPSSGEVALQQTVAGISVPPGFAVETYAAGLRFPTALAFGPDGRLYVAQLNGPENAGSGQVVRLDGPGRSPSVVIDGLNKPTGLAWRDERLYIAAGREVLRTEPAGDGFAPPVAVVQGLPFNGRSEGQIELLPDGRLLFESSGDVGDPQQGRLLVLDRDEQVTVLASGLKNAYAHAVDPLTGQLYTTEIGDDPVDGNAAPPEEINLVQPDANYGWPFCYGAAMPVQSRGGTAESCATTEPATIVFGPHSTPTGLTFYGDNDFPAPYGDALFIALWNGTPPQVLAVPRSQLAGSAPASPLPFVRGVERPIDLLPHPQGGLLVLDYAAGTILRVVGSSR